MATATGLTKERMLEIEGASVVDAAVVGDDLILIRHNGTTINAGDVRGEPGGSDGVTFTFTTPVTQWVCPHNLNTMFPDHNVFVNGERVLAGLTVVDANNATINFFSPTAGTVRLRK